MKIMGKNRMIIIKCIEKIGWIMTKISPCCEARYKPSLIKWRSSSTCSHGLDPAATCRADFRVFSTMEGSYIRYLSTVNRKSCQGLKIKPNHCKFCHMSFFAPAGVSNIWVGITNCLRLHRRTSGNCQSSTFAAEHTEPRLHSLVNDFNFKTLWNRIAKV